jgi:hypothetical protein
MNSAQIDASDIRDGLFLAPSRSYAEQYLEPMIRELLGFSLPTNGDHDAIDKHGNKIEIKASKVLRKTNNTKHHKSLYERIIYEKTNVETNRMFDFSEATTADYLANIQNVKRDHFKILIYVLLFKDQISIFSLKSDQIGTNLLPSWSDKHGRYDKLGKSGQFPIQKSNINWHLNNALLRHVSYEEIAKIYENLSA